MKAILLAVGKLICGMKRKHARRKCIYHTDEKRTLQCPRCGDTVTRKAKKKKAVGAEVVK